VRAAIPLLFSLVLAAAAAAQQADVDARVTYLVPEGAYIDAGTEQGLATGLTGTVLRDGKPVAKAEIIAASARSARLRIYDGNARIGDLVRFRVEKAPETTTAPEEEAKRPEKSGEFVPLLERQKVPAAVSTPRNVSHGRIALDQYVQTAALDALEYWRSSLSSSGDVQRLWGKPWSLDWSFTASARGGEIYVGSVLEGVRLDVYELTLSRRLGEDGVVRFGRFVPKALPAAGYLDGVLYEQRLAPGFKGGAILALRPTLDDLTPSAKEPTAVLYGTLDMGTRRADYFTGTLGVLGSMYEGDTDRVAVLLDSFGRAGIFELGIDATVDLDVGSQLFTSGTRLTQLNARAAVQVARGTRVRCGTDHFENLDTAANRDALDVVDPLLFDVDVWRYYVGGTQALPAKLTLDVEITFIDAADTDNTLSWYVTLTRYGLFGSPVASASLTIYSIEGFGVDGIGGLLSAYVPLRSNKLTLQASLGFRSFDPAGLDTFEVTDARAYLTYELAPKWTLNGGASIAIGDDADHVLLQIGVQYRW